MVTQTILSPEERSALASECSGISGLIEWLDDLDRRPGLPELDTRLSNLDVNMGAIEECIGYSEDGYQRNVIKKTEHY